MKSFINSFDLDTLHVFFPEHFLIYHKNRCSNEHAKKSFSQIGFLKIFFSPLTVWQSWPSDVVG